MSNNNLINPWIYYDALQCFTNNLFGNVRSILINNEPWFVGSDVARCLGYIDTDQAIRQHVYDENKYLAKPVELTCLEIGPRGSYIINEAGLYQLIFTSKLPIAKEFTKWVTSEVLPTMRRIGYSNSMKMLQEENERLKIDMKILNQKLEDSEEYKNYLISRII